MRRTLALLACLSFGCSSNPSSGPDGGGDAGYHPPADLILSEASAALTPATPAWVEVYNATATAKDLAQYHLRSGVLFDDGGFDGAGTDFALDSRTIAPGGFVVVSGKPFADLYASPQLVLAGEPDASFYFTADGGPGFVQLVNAEGTPVDALVFGAGATAGWQGAPAPLPSGPADFGRVLARHLDRSDTDTAADWSVCEFATPAGPNDAFDATDDDGDGLPDSAERPGGTYAGLPLYDWGARTGQRDVFVEVDWMSTDGGNGRDPGMEPRVEALDHVRHAFAPHGIAMHFDLGSRSYQDGGELDAGAYDLGGGDEVPWACTITMAGVAGATNFYQLKAAHSDLRRRPSFHYVIFGNSIADVSCGGRGATGRAEQGGNDVELALGTRVYKDDTPARVDQVINVQAATLMHELGHNFGLRHGGFEDTNYKPNYLSVMNYLYQLDGLPVVGTNEGDRFYLLYGGATGLCPAGAPTVDNPGQLTQGPGTADFIIDYSDGSSAPLDQAMLDESKGLGRAGSAGVDFNWNGMIDGAPVSADIDSADGSAQCPQGTTGSGVLKDHDDWSALVLPFAHQKDGAQSGARRSAIDVMGDRQPVMIETPIRR